MWGRCQASYQLKSIPRSVFGKIPGGRHAGLSSSCSPVVVVSAVRSHCAWWNRLCCFFTWSSLAPLHLVHVYGVIGDNYWLFIGQQIGRWNPEQHCEHCVILVPVRMCVLCVCCGVLCFCRLPASATVVDLCRCCLSSAVLC